MSNSPNLAHLLAPIVSLTFESCKNLGTALLQQESKSFPQALSLLLPFAKMAFQDDDVSKHQRDSGHVDDVPWSHYERPGPTARE